METPISFFLRGAAGNLFAMYYAPAEAEPDFGDILYVHPFAGEMFASRTVIAACARDLAAAGFGVLTVDLYGCGDSSGDFSDARWEIWRDDLVAAVQWLQAQGRDRLSLWGLRLGALLATDFAAYSRLDFERIILWQPVVTGRNMLTQFFRMNLDEADTLVADRLTSPEQRRLLRDEEKIEVAGYGLAPALIRAVDRLEIGVFGKNASAPIHWVEFSDARNLPAESRRVVEDWNRNGVRVTTTMMASGPFWLFPHGTDPAPLAKWFAATLRDAETAAEKTFQKNN
ncbi:MAG: hydrolase 2, exosortase A system-associated [Candidatus Sulfotelmatobacter sp.]|jgi:exosortase A-associated hydrolase 2